MKAWRMAIVIVLLIVGSVTVASGNDDERQVSRRAHHRIAEKAQELSMTQVEVLGIACEVYTNVYRSEYPAMAFGSAERLAALMVPDLLPEPIVQGPWGETIYYWSDGLSYLIISAGRDRILDTDYQASLQIADDELRGEALVKLCDTARSDMDADIIFLNGSFCNRIRHDT